jgi:hypothetical protein
MGKSMELCTALGNATAAPDNTHDWKTELRELAP